MGTDGGFYRTEPKVCLVRFAPPPSSELPGSCVALWLSWRSREQPDYVVVQFYAHCAAMCGTIVIHHSYSPYYAVHVDSTIYGFWYVFQVLLHYGYETSDFRTSRHPSSVFHGSGQLICVDTHASTDRMHADRGDMLTDIHKRDFQPCLSLDTVFNFDTAI